MSTNTWSYYVTVVDRTNNLLHLYADGTEVGSAKNISGTGSVTNSFNLQFGNQSTGNNHALNGKMDEARVVNGILSPGWIGTEYNSESSPSTFYTVSSLISQ